MSLPVPAALVPAVLVPAASAQGAEDPTALRFRAGLAALAAAQSIADRRARNAKLDEAIAAFRAILVNRPGLVRVRLELARAFFLKEEDTLARRHFEQALAGKLPPAVVDNIRRFLNVMRARRRWEAHFGMAIAPDSNVNTASSGRTILLDTFLGRLPFRLSDDSAAQSGIGLSVWGGGEYQYPLGDPGTGAGRWRIRAGADASMRDYKGRDFDRHSVSTRLGPRLLIDARTEASLLATAGRQWAAGRPETDRVGLRLEGRHRPAPRLTLFGRADYAWHDCLRCDWLDGTAGNVSFGVAWVALPTLRVGGNAGWNWRSARAEHWRSSGPQAGLGATAALPAGFTVGLNAFVRRTVYRGSGLPHFTIDRKPRRDTLLTLSISVHNRALTVFGFSPRISLVNERRETNAQLLDYRRTRGELGVVRQF